MKKGKILSDEITIDVGLFWKETKEVIRRPTALLSRIRNDKSIKDLVIYFILISLLSSLASLVFVYLLNPLLSQVLPSLFTAPDNITSFPMAISVILVGTAIVAVLSFAWAWVLHLWIRLFKGSGSYKDTYQIFVYSRAPLGLFGWIPFVGIVASLWTFVIIIKGIHLYHGMSKRKSALIMIAPIIGLMILQVLSIILFSTVAPS